MNKEEKILRHLLKAFSEPDEISTKQRAIKTISLLVGITLIVTAYLLIPKDFTTGKIAVVIGVFGGIVMYFWSFYSIAVHNTYYLKKYLNKSEIEARLNEIKT